MKPTAKKRKSDFVRMVMSDIHESSSNSELSKEFLEEEGVNISTMREDGLKRIKKMQLLANAQRTKSNMEKASKVADQAIAIVEKLLSDVTFSFQTFIKKEGLLVSYSNFESNSPEDMKAILVKHYTLKLMNEDNDSDTKDL